MFLRIGCRLGDNSPHYLADDRACDPTFNKDTGTYINIDSMYFRDVEYAINVS